MQYVIGLLIILIIVVCIIGFQKQNRRKNILTGIRNNWGEVKNDYFDFELIEMYFNTNKGEYFHKLSPQTKYDIDFNDLFCFIDRTTSKLGQQYLYNKLSTPTNYIDHLKETEKQVTFFLQNQATRELIQTQLFKLHNNDSYFIAGLLEDNVVTKSKWSWLFIADTILMALLLIATPIFHRCSILALILFAINLFLHFSNKNNTYKFGRSFPQLYLLIEIAKDLSKHNIPFEIKETQNSIKNLHQFQSKYSILSFAQFTGDELTQLLAIFLELIKAVFLIEIHTFNSIITIIKNKKEDIATLYSFVGSIDTAISIGSLRSGGLQYCSPEFIASEKALSTSDIFHPLIPGCITNSIDIHSKSILITGSNMSGKSTFLRTIAINSILAQTINTCFARKYKTPFFKLFSSIRIEDDLSEGKSFYMAEVNSIGNLIKETSSDSQNFYLLDEVFKGTNTVERIAASKAILSYLNKNDNLVMVSTHDLELTELLYNEYDLYHFEEKIQEQKLVFDYLLKQGPLKSRNAIKILALSAYPPEIIEEANAISNHIADNNLLKLKVG